MKKKVFITGISGMVGSHLADYLLANTEFEIHGLVRWRSNLANISHLAGRVNNSDRLFLQYSDLRDSAALDKVVRKVNPDYVFHLAAQSYPQTSFDSPVDTLETNIIGTTNLLESLRGINSTSEIHVCASSEVFGRVSKEFLPIHEEVPFHPASPYAISKVGTDLIGRYYAEAYGLRVQTTRMFTHTGPRRGDVFAESSFAKQIALIEAGFLPPIVKVGNLDSLRTFADVRDAVDAYYLLLTKNPILGAYYNIGGTYSCTIENMLNTLLSFSTTSRITIEVDPARLRPIDADLQVPDTSKFINHTGWKPKFTFEQTMHDLLEYWRSEVKKFSGQLLSR
jgi:GDP-mannose 4,6-dehydratase